MFIQRIKPCLQYYKYTRFDTGGWCFTLYGKKVDGYRQIIIVAYGSRLRFRISRANGMFIH